jgi:DNA helicase HerA-like ATPase
MDDEPLDLDEMAEDLGVDDETTVDQAVGSELANKDESNAVGHVAVSRGLHIGQDEQFINAYIWTDCRDKVRVGDYVFIPLRNNNNMFAIVRSLNYDTDSLTVSDLDDLAFAGSRTVDDDRYPYIACLDPITILPEEDDADSDEVTRRAVDTLPKPFAKLYPVEDRDAIYRGLNLPMTGIPTGYLSVGGQTVTDSSGEKIVYNLLDPDPYSARDPAVFRHLLVAGATGKGKTQLSKNVLRQFAGGDMDSPKYLIEDDSGNQTEQELCTVIIDPENEYSELANDPTLTQEEQKKLQKYEQEGFNVGGVDDCVAFVPDIRWTNDVETEASKTYNFSIPFSIVEGRPELLMPFSAGEPTINAIKTVTSDYFNRIGTNEQGEYTDFIQYVSQSRQEYVDNGSIHDSVWDAMVNRIDDPMFQNVFDQGSQTLTEIEDQMFKSGRVTVIPTDHIKGKQEKLVVMVILSHIVENKLKSFRASDCVKNTPILLCVDEAHNYLSDRNNSQGEYIIRKFVEAAKQGRKEKLGLYMVTQNPLDIDEEIRHQTNTKVYLGLEAATVRKANVPPEFEERVPIFGRGQAAIKAPDVRPVEIQGLDICLTQHKS